MIAQNSTGSDGPTQSLSPAVAAELAAAMRACAVKSPTADEWMRRAMAAAAAEARAVGLRAEDLVIALKTIERDAGREVIRTPREQDAFHTKILHALLEAYFRESS